MIRSSRFNGAADYSAELPTMRPGSGPDDGLQWSRADYSAELPLAWRGVWTQVKLQWSRADYSTEFDAGDPGAKLFAASMEPR